MGAARKAWDEAKHFRGYHGRFAEGRDRSPEVLGGGRAANAFHPRPPAAEARARKERVPSKVRDLVGIRDRVDRGEQVSWRDEQKVSWAAPRRMAAQRAKTGDILVPRTEIARRARSYQRAAAINPRTGIKKTFTGQAKVERGNYRELLIPTPGRPGSFEMRVESRVRRPFDWPARGGRKPAPPAPPKKTAPPFNPALTHDARLREIAREMGLDVPKRAGRNQLLKLIQGA